MLLIMVLVINRSGIFFLFGRVRGYVIVLVGIIENFYLLIYYVKILWVNFLCDKLNLGSESSIMISNFWDYIIFCIVCYLLERGFLEVY